MSSQTSCTSAEILTDWPQPMKNKDKQPLRLASTKITLMSRECSSMASSWTEFLCFERLSPGRFSIQLCGHEILGFAHDLIPADELYDEDGEMVIPTELNGQAVSLVDGEFLASDVFVEDPACDPVEFGSDELERALAFCREQDWSAVRGFGRVWRRLRELVRLDGRDPSVQFKSPPVSFQGLIDDLVDRSLGRGSKRRGFKRLGRWIAAQDWDALVDDSPGGGRIGLALDLREPWGFLSDAALVDNEARGDPLGLTNPERTAYARRRFTEMFQEPDDSVLSAVAYPILHSDGTSALMCGVIRLHGQAGPEVEWHGPFGSTDAHLDWMSGRGLLHEDDLQDLADSDILDAWAQ